MLTVWAQQMVLNTHSFKEREAYAGKPLAATAGHYRDHVTTYHVHAGR